MRVLVPEVSRHLIVPGLKEPQSVVCRQAWQQTIRIERYLLLMLTDSGGVRLAGQ